MQTSDKAIALQDQLIVALQSIIEKQEKAIAERDQKLNLAEILIEREKKAIAGWESAMKGEKKAIAGWESAMIIIEEQKKAIARQNRRIKIDSCLGVVLVSIAGKSLFSSYFSGKRASNLPMITTDVIPSATLILPINSAIEKLNDLNNLEQSTEDIHPSWATIGSDSQGFTKNFTEKKTWQDFLNRDTTPNLDASQIPF